MLAAVQTIMDKKQDISSLGVSNCDCQLSPIPLIIIIIIIIIIIRLIMYHTRYVIVTLKLTGEVVEPPL